jgi:hypothetical protein
VSHGADRSQPRRSCSAVSAPSASSARRGSVGGSAAKPGMGFRDFINRLLRSPTKTPERRGPFAATISADAVTLAPDSTWMLRNSDYRFWVALRARLQVEGIDHKTTVVAESFEEGATAPGAFDAEEVGVLVSADGHVVEYRYSYGREVWVTWADITHTWRTSRHAEVIENALSQSE